MHWGGPSRACVSSKPSIKTTLGLPAGGSRGRPSLLIIKNSPTVGLRPWVECQKPRRCVCSREFRRSDVGELYPVALQTVGTSGSVRIHPRRHRRWRALPIGRSAVPEPSPVQQNTPGGGSIAESLSSPHTPSPQDGWSSTGYSRAARAHYRGTFSLESLQV